MAVKDAWVLRLKEESKEIEMIGDHYFRDDDECDFVTDDLQEATIYYDKDYTIEGLKKYESIMIRNYGKDAIVNFGYTNMMENFEFVEVTVGEQGDSSI
ncbi:hypothetical protein [Sporosarcina sp. FSL K6-5500]|uniref:hypothetical protein n=1 Tax=Sporosarcina sp. FSL K6-5500 TaxID=2921558 RepID=UPI0030FCA0A6